MSKRTERREAERLARKAAYQELRRQRLTNVNSDPTEEHSEVPEAQLTALSSFNPEETIPAAILDLTTPAIDVSSSGANLDEPISPISEAQLIANRANAQLSSGPVTPEGKAKSSQNALKHGLTGAAVLLPTEDAVEYERLLEAWQRFYKPVGEEEHELVHSMVDSHWRIRRAQSLQMGIFYKGDLEFAKQFADQDPAKRRMLINLETYLKYEKSLRNIQTQEARLHRRYEKDVAELKRIQQARKSEELQAAKASRTTPAHPNGFESSTPKPHSFDQPRHTSQSAKKRASAAGSMAL